MLLQKVYLDKKETRTNSNKLSSITIGYVQYSTKKAKQKIKNKVQQMRILLNSGCGAILINKKFVNQHKSTKDKQTNWITKAGKFKTTRKYEVDFTLPVFDAGKIVTWNCYVNSLIIPTIIII